MARVLVTCALVLASCGSEGDAVPSSDSPTTAAPTAAASTTESVSPALTSTSSTDASSTAPPSSVAQSTSTTVERDGPVSSSAREHGVEITVTTSGLVTAGERIPISIDIAHVGDDVVHWQAGGCGYPAAAAVGPAGARVTRTPEPAWDGDLAKLGRWVEVANGLSLAQPAQPDDVTGRREIACPDDLVLEPFSPGDTLTMDASAEVRVPPGALPGNGAYEVTATFVSYAHISSYPNGAQETTVTVPITVVDHRDREAGSDSAALAAVAADLRVGGWIGAQATGNPQLTQEFGVELSWWRGAWELWIVPKWSERERLRARFDVPSGDLVDVRAVPQGSIADDEPGAVEHPAERSDRVLVPIDPPTSMPPASPPPPPTTSPATMPAVGALEASVVLTDELVPIEPQTVFVVDATRPVDGLPTPVAIATSDNGVITVVDAGTRTISLYSESNGGPITEIPFEPTEFATPTFYFGALVGPDDVLYLMEVEGASNRVGAYAIVDGAYRLVAASEWWEAPADGQPFVVLGPTGPAYATSMTEPLLEYVDPTGAPSGATLPTEPIVARFFADGQTHDLERGGASWRLTMTVSSSNGRLGLAGICPGCVVTVGSPHDVLVVDGRGARHDGESLVAVLAPDDVTVHRLLWNYVGATLDSLVFSRDTDRGLEIGVLRL